MRTDNRNYISVAAVGLCLALTHAFPGGAEEKDLPITVATQNYGHTRALQDGTLRVPGCAVQYATLSLAELNGHAFGDKQFDVTEVELLPFLTRWGKPETAEYVLLPVFPLREFQLRNIWVHADSKIHGLQDLRGSTVAVAGYGSTSAAWIRGYLLSTGSIRPEELTWVDTRKLATGQTPWDLLNAEKVDAAFDIHLPPKDSERIQRLFPDYRRAEQEEFAATRVFPIVSVLAVRKKLLEENPWLAEALFMAFCDAKRKSIENLGTESEPKIPLPWGAEFQKETLDLMGKNFWSYGVPNNPRTLKTLLQYANALGKFEKQINTEDVFDPTTVQLFDK